MSGAKTAPDIPEISPFVRSGAAMITKLLIIT